MKNEMQDAAKELITLMRARLDNTTFEKVLNVLDTVRQRRVPDSMLFEEALHIDTLVVFDPIVSTAYAVYWERYFPFERMTISGIEFDGM